MAISEAEKIKKAEEIYLRRRMGQNVRANENIRKNSFFKWLIKNVIYIMLIIACIHGYNNREYFLSEKFKNDFNSFINTKINARDFIRKLYTNKEENVENLKENEEKSLEKLEENSNENKESSLKNDEKIIYVSNISGKSLDESYKKKEEENIKNIGIQEYVKLRCTFKRPIKGVVTSRYGIRNSKYKNVSKHHTGIDIGANTGTDIYSSIEGNVIEVSSKGNYGKHLKIASKIDSNIVTLYAHCSKILVKKGDKIKIGQKIAKVGSTGNTTGPHLHFEIRYKNDYIDPEKILEF